MHQSLEDRFWPKVAKPLNPNSKECWEWIGSLSSRGYGQLQVNRRPKGAHVISYEIHKGKTGGLFVCHHCDNPRCVRPDHLFLGTCKQNAEDMVDKGRAPKHKGERNPACKITKDQAIEIKRMAKSGKDQKTIAREFSISQSQVSGIKNGRKWREL